MPRFTSCVTARKRSDLLRCQLQGLVTQMGQLGVALPEMDLLQAAVARLEGFQSRARAAVAGRPTRQLLADLQQVSPCKLRRAFKSSHVNNMRTMLWQLSFGYALRYPRSSASQRTCLAQKHDMGKPGQMTRKPSRPAPFVLIVKDMRRDDKQEEGRSHVSWPAHCKTWMRHELMGVIVTGG